MSLPDTATATSRVASGKSPARAARQRSDGPARGGNLAGSSTAGTTGVLNLGSCTSAPGQRAKTDLDDKVLAALKERALLQERGYALAGQKYAVHRCGCDPRRRDRAVAVGVGEFGGAQVAGMQHCASRWCPRCWGLVTKTRTSDVQQVTKWATEQGKTIALVTLTAAHTTKAVEAAAQAAGVSKADAVRMQPLQPLLDGMQKAWSAMVSGRPGQALKSGWTGYVRAVELTADDYTVPAGQRTETGYHVHWHVVLVLDEAEVQAAAEAEAVRLTNWAEHFSRPDLREAAEADAAAARDAAAAATPLEGLTARMLRRWLWACDRADLRADEKGFDVRRCKDPLAAAAYVTKGEVTKKDLGRELSSSGTKSAGRGRVTPEQILRNIGRAVETTTGTKRRRPQDLVSADLREPAVYPSSTLSRLRAQWQEIESAFNGARWLTWSRDLRKLAGLGEEETAEEVANAAVAPASSRVAVMDGRHLARHGRWAAVDAEAEAEAWDGVRLERTADPAAWVQNLGFWQVKAGLDRHLHSLPEALDAEARFDSLTGWLAAQGITDFRVLSWEDWQGETTEALRAEGAEHHARAERARAEAEAAERLAERLAAADDAVPAPSPFGAAPAVPAGHSLFGPLPWLAEGAAK